VSTVGYGDITPVSEISRFSIMLLILIELITIPKQMNELINLMSIQSVYSLNEYKKTEEIPFIVVCGKFDVETLNKFCIEIFHNDHVNIDKNVIIVDMKTPDLKMEKLLNDQKFEIFLTYIKGNPKHQKHLDRSKILNAQSVNLIRCSFLHQNTRESPCAKIGKIY
jgi:acetyl-CoA C-acetyltransferase/potassium large conductance calcium-activated channel subfamily M alpha protein 1